MDAKSQKALTAETEIAALPWEQCAEGSSLRTKRDTHGVADGKGRTVGAMVFVWAFDGWFDVYVTYTRDGVDFGTTRERLKADTLEAAKREGDRMLVAARERMLAKYGPKSK